MKPRFERVGAVVLLGEQALIRRLAWVAAFFVAAHMAGQTAVAIAGRERIHEVSLLGLVDEFNLDAEMNLPTYFSCFLLALCGVLLLLIARHIRETRRPMEAYWRILGWAFFVMSFDEFGGIHEKINSFLKVHNAGLESTGVLHFPWVIVGVPFVAIMGAIYLRFLFHLPGRFRNGFLLAGAIYLGGALGMEMVGGWYSDAHGQNWTYFLLVAIEEGMEMTGAILFAKHLLRFLAQDVGEIRVLFSGARFVAAAHVAKEHEAATA